MKNCRGIIAAAVMGASIALAGQAGATTITEQTFDTDPILGASQAPGVWYTDRFAPAGFESEFFDGDNRLAHTISSADGATSRPSGFASSFYNTQGRKFDTAGANSISVDFYVDSAFQNDSGRIAGIWGTGFAGDGSTITHFPIIEFANSAFQVWDGTQFVAPTTAPIFSFDTFVNLAIVLDTVNDVFNFSIAGQEVLTTGASGTQSIGNIILQNINTEAGVDRTVYWDNLTAEAVAPVPVPAALPLLAAAIAGLGFAGWRKRHVNA